MKPLLREGKKLFARYQQADISTRAAALAFHTLLAIVPIVGVIFWYLSYLEVTESWLSLTKTYLLQQLNVNSSAAFEKHFTALTTAVHGRSWGWVGFGFLVYTAWNLIAKFGDTLDCILESHAHPPEFSFGRLALVLRRLLVMLVLPVALATSLGVSQWIRKDSWFHLFFDLKAVGPLVALPFAYLGSVVAVFLVYFLVPRKSVPWKQALKAAAVVGPLSEIVRYGFGLYNGYAVSVHKIYGVLAVIPMFILWVQVAWTVLLSGALLVGFSRRS